MSTAVGGSFRNRIINGDMRIDQRNAGASVTPTNGTFTYTIDRWKYYVTQASKLTAQQNAGAVTPPAGFTNYLGTTSSSAYSVISSDLFTVYHAVEGFNVADFAWGTASAATITISFWVRSSLTGTHSGAIQNSANNRSYIFSYTISVANTWEKKSVTIAGDQSGTWLTTNGIGLSLYFNLGAGSTYSTTAGSWQAGNFTALTGAVSVVGTNGATFYITGVQLEQGSTATEFERRPIGAELALCQRYYQKTYELGTAPATLTTVGAINYIATGAFQDLNDRLMVEMRSIPSTVQILNPATGTAGEVRNYSNGVNYAATINNGAGQTSSKQTQFRTNVLATSANELTYHLTIDAEL
jgi:hypothetical protein